MRRRHIFVCFLALTFASILMFTLPGCNMVKGFGKDISNVAEAGENMINGQGSTVSSNRSSSAYRR